MAPQVERPDSEFCAIKSPADAVAYPAPPSLGVRLLECTETVLEHAGRSPYDLKFQSSRTLFELAGGGPVLPRRSHTFTNANVTRRHSRSSHTGPVLVSYLGIAQCRNG